MGGCAVRSGKGLREVPGFRYQMPRFANLGLALSALYLYLGLGSVNPQVAD